MTLKTKYRPEYSAWYQARRRCENPACWNYSIYGGRGIKMLFPDFESFFVHIGPRPDKTHSLDRINNNGNYEPGNIRWATKKQQAANRGSSGPAPRYPTPTGRAAQFRETIFGRPNTVKAKLSLFDNHIAPYISASATTDELAQRAIKDWKDNGLSALTIKMLFVLLKSYIKFTSSIDIDAKKLSFQHFSNQMVPKHKLKVWTPSQVVAALDKAEECDPELHDLMAVVLGTGLRKGELFALTWNDVDIMNGTIEVNKSLDTETGAVGPTKTKHSRTVQMNLMVARVMEKGYTPGKEGDRCFRTFNPNKRLGRVCRLAGVPDISFHDLRHTFATTCLERGMSPKWVSTTLGHAKLTTTLDVYWQHFQEKVDLEGLYE